MNEQGADFVPEITPEHEQAYQQEDITAKCIGQRILSECGNIIRSIDG